MIQDSLFPNTVYLTPLLQAVSEHGGPVRLEDVTPTMQIGERVRVRTHDDISVELDMFRVLYTVTVEIERHEETFSMDTGKNLSPFYRAWISDALKHDAISRGWKLTLKAEFKDGLYLRSAGLVKGDSGLQPTPECFLVAQAWLEQVERKTRTKRVDALVESAYERIHRRREELELLERQRQRREQEAAAAELEGDDEEAEAA